MDTTAVTALDTTAVTVLRDTETVGRPRSRAGRVPLPTGCRRRAATRTADWFRTRPTGAPRARPPARMSEARNRSVAGLGRGDPEIASARHFRRALRRHWRPPLACHRS